MQFYSPDNTPTNSFWPAETNIDLRIEMHGILFGDFEKPGIGRPITVRYMTDTECPCFNKSTGSGDPQCEFCDGEGYQFSEVEHIAYIARNFGSVLNPSSVIAQESLTEGYGMTDNQRAVAYVEFFVFPNYERYLAPQYQTYDKLYELKVDFAGNKVLPEIRVAKWKIRSVTPHHGDFGRVEYIECGLEKENL